jgi:hypothetical protein
MPLHGPQSSPVVQGIHRLGDTIVSAMVPPLDTDETPTRTTGRAGFWVALAIFGFVLVAIGLATDFVLHANDSSLAADEGIFTLSNPGHLLAGLGLIVVAVGLGRAASIMIGTADDESRLLRIARVALGIGAVALIGSMVYIVVGPGFSHDHGTELPNATVLFDGVDRSRLPDDEALALATLVWSRPGSLTEDMHHDHDDAEPRNLTPQESEALDSQFAVATAARTRLDTVAEAEALGYVQGSGVSDGSGAHWIKWTLVDKPFDIENPSMLLFDELKRGEPMELIAYSYWVASEHAPEGFAGETDQWHRHLGMCFDGGWLKDDNIPDRRSCAGDWVNGSDLWMLHAWVVPGLENTYGQFHNVNPLLCERACGLEN